MASTTGYVRTRKSSTTEKNIFITAGDSRGQTGGTLEIGHYVQPGTVCAIKTITGISGRVGQKLIAPYRQTADLASSAALGASTITLDLTPAVDVTTGAAKNPMDLISLAARMADGETLTFRVYNTATEGSTNYEDIAVTSINATTNVVTLTSTLSSACAVASRVVLKDGSELATDSTTGGRTCFISLDYVDTRYTSEQSDALQAEAAVTGIFASTGQLDFSQLLGWDSAAASALPQISVV